MRATLFGLLFLAAPVLAQDWAGEWENESIRLELQAEGAGLAGTLAVGGQRYPLTATAKGANLLGSFIVEGTRFEVAATLEGDTLRLVSDGNEHRLRRVGRWPWEPFALPEALVREAGAAGGRVLPGGDARAPELLRAALHQIGAAFGAAPRPVGALCEANGAEGQLLFEGRVEGAPVRGVLLVRAKAEGRPAEVVVGWTRADAFAQSMGPLMQALGGGPAAGSAPPVPVEWQPVYHFPDGSGQIRAPVGWNATFAQKGAIDASGPEGSLSLGAARTVMVPAAAAQMFARPPLVAEYTDPARVMVDLLPSENEWARKSGAGYQVESLRVLEQSPTEYPNGKAAYLHTESVVLDAKGQRTTYRAFTLVVIAPVSNDSFMYYTSQVAAPAEKWTRSLPVLLEIWKSWQVSQAELNRRLSKAAETMREINAIIRSVNDERLRTFENTNKAWSNVQRGEWPIEDTSGAEPRQRVDLDGLKPTLEALNKEAGYERWREVPLRDLVPR